jgi:hypothetical protein
MLFSAAEFYGHFGRIMLKELETQAGGKINVEWLSAIKVTFPDQDI